MEKHIAVIIKERQEEGLRLALGLLMLFDKIDIYFLDQKIEETSKNRSQLKTVSEAELNLYTNCSENKDMHLVSNEEIANQLLNYNTVLKY